MVGFTTQVQAGSNKSMYSNMKNKPIGRLPDFFKVDQASVDAVATFRYAGNAQHMHSEPRLAVAPGVAARISRTNINLGMIANVISGGSNLTGNDTADFAKLGAAQQSASLKKADAMQEPMGHQKQLAQVGEQSEGSSSSPEDGKKATKDDDHM